MHTCYHVQRQNDDGSGWLTVKSFDSPLLSEAQTDALARAMLSRGKTFRVVPERGGVEEEPLYAACCP